MKVLFLWILIILEIDFIDSIFGHEPLKPVTLSNRRDKSGTDFIRGLIESRVTPNHQIYLPNSKSNFFIKFHCFKNNSQKKTRVHMFST